MCVQILLAKFKLGVDSSSSLTFPESWSTALNYRGVRNPAAHNKNMRKVLTKKRKYKIPDSVKRIATRSARVLLFDVSSRYLPTVRRYCLSRAYINISGWRTRCPPCLECDECRRHPCGRQRRVIRRQLHMHTEGRIDKVAGGFGAASSRGGTKGN